ncbi:hypothetical protein LMIY3S_01804 [Labrys miyagiensis]
MKTLVAALVFGGIATAASAQDTTKPQSPPSPSDLMAMLQKQQSQIAQLSRDIAILRQQTGLGVWFASKTTDPIILQELANLKCQGVLKSKYALAFGVSYIAPNAVGAVCVPIAP